MAHNVLLVAGAPPDVSSSELRLLTKQASFIVAADSGGDALQQIGVAPDILIGDMDSITPAAFESAQHSGAKVHSFNRDKDATDYDLALNLPEVAAANSITAAGVLGGRVDHELGAIASTVGFCERFDTAVHIVHHQQSMHILRAKSSKHHSFEIPAQLGAKTFAVSAVAWGGNAQVSIKGLRWELNKANVSPNKTWGVSNEYNNKDAVITAHKGIVLVILNFE